MCDEHVTLREKSFDDILLLEIHLSIRLAYITQLLSHATASYNLGNT